MSLIEIAGAWEAGGIRYLLIGSTAIALHTKRPELAGDDLDFLVPNRPEELYESGEILKRLRFALFTRRGVVLGDLAVMAHTMQASRAIRGGEVVDLAPLVFCCPFEESWRDRETLFLQGHPIHTLPLSKLLASKKATDRDKDRQFFARHPELADWT